MEGAGGNMRVTLQAIEDLIAGLRTMPDDRPEWLVKATPDSTSVPYYRFLLEFTRRFRPDLIVEIGTGRAGSAAHLAAGNPEGKVVTLDVDPESKKLADAFRRDNLIALTEDSIQAARLVRLLPPIDLLFIDGQHSFEQAFREYATYRPMMRDGGIILFDDICLPQARDQMQAFWESVVDPKLAANELHYTGFGISTVDQSKPLDDSRRAAVQPERCAPEARAAVTSTRLSAAMPHGPRRLGAAIPVLNEWRFVPAVTGQLLKVVDRCVILRPSGSQSGAPVELTPIPDLDPRIDVLEGNWRTEAETRNAGMDYLNDCDYVFMVDSDEIVLDDDLEILRDLCLSGKHRVIASRLFTYWKTPEYRIDPPEQGTIKIVLRREVRLHGVREVAGDVHMADIWLRHLSYVRTDDEVREKVRVSGHAREILPGWYERVWKAWDQNHDLEDLHPVHPPAYRRAVCTPDPALEATLARWGCR